MRQGRALTSHPLLVSWSWKSRAIPLLLLLAVLPVHILSACTVQLHLYSPYGPYCLYTSSVPVQYSYTSTPIGRTACTEPQCLYSTAIPLLLLAVRRAQSLSACTRVHFTFTLHTVNHKSFRTRFHGTGCDRGM